MSVKVLFIIVFVISASAFAAIPENDFDFYDDTVDFMQQDKGKGAGDQLFEDEFVAASANVKKRKLKKIKPAEKPSVSIGAPTRFDWPEMCALSVIVIGIGVYLFGKVCNSCVSYIIIFRLATIT